MNKHLQSTKPLDRYFGCAIAKFALSPRFSIACRLLSVGCVIILGAPAYAAPSVGQPAPALIARQIDGTAFDLSAMRGKVVIVNFWATWCKPCREEMPALDSFYRKYHTQSVEMIGIDGESGRAKGDVRKAMQPFAYGAAMIGDVKPNGFGDVRRFPVTYVIDASGVIRAKFQDASVPLTVDSLTATVVPLLPSPPQSTSPADIAH